jgi:hypothetical protein
VAQGELSAYHCVISENPPADTEFSGQEEVEMWPEIILILIGITVVFYKLEAFGSRLRAVETRIDKSGLDNLPEDDLGDRFAKLESDVDNLRDKFSSLESEADKLRSGLSDLNEGEALRDDLPQKVLPAATSTSAAVRVRCAIDFKTGKVAWSFDGGSGGGILTTAGQLVFSGSRGGDLVALDPATGKVLWHTHAGRSTNPPITYQLDGRQYVLSGIGTSLAAFTLPSCG